MNSNAAIWDDTIEVVRHRTGDACSMARFGEFGGDAIDGLKTRCAEHVAEEAE